MHSRDKEPKRFDSNDTYAGTAFTLAMTAWTIFDLRNNSRSRTPSSLAMSAASIGAGCLSLVAKVEWVTGSQNVFAQQLKSIARPIAFLCNVASSACSIVQNPFSGFSFLGLGYLSTLGADLLYRVNHTEKEKADEDHWCMRCEVIAAGKIGTDQGIVNRAAQYVRDQTQARWDRIYNSVLGSSPQLSSTPALTTANTPEKKPETGTETEANLAKAIKERDAAKLALAAPQQKKAALNKKCEELYDKLHERRYIPMDKNGAPIVKKDEQGNPIKTKGQHGKRMPDREQGLDYLQNRLDEIYLNQKHPDSRINAFFWKNDKNHDGGHNTEDKHLGNEYTTNEYRAINKNFAEANTKVVNAEAEVTRLQAEFNALPKTAQTSSQVAHNIVLPVVAAPVPAPAPAVPPVVAAPAPAPAVPPVVVPAPAPALCIPSEKAANKKTPEQKLTLHLTALHKSIEDYSLTANRVRHGFHGGSLPSDMREIKGIMMCIEKQSCSLKDGLQRIKEVAQHNRVIWEAADRCFNLVNGTHINLDKGHLQYRSK